MAINGNGKEADDIQELGRKDEESGVTDIFRTEVKKRISKIKDGILAIKEKYRIENLSEFTKMLIQGFPMGDEDIENYFVLDNFEAEIQKVQGTFFEDKNMVEFSELHKIVKKDFSDIVRQVEVEDVFTKCDFIDMDDFSPDSLWIPLIDGSSIEVLLSYILRSCPKRVGNFM